MSTKNEGAYSSLPPVIIEDGIRYVPEEPAKANIFEHYAEEDEPDPKLNELHELDVIQRLSEAYRRNTCQ